MSYQVLARKWRPQHFSEMVGQSHVLQALHNALDSQRLHHAYLFTGTRGVGKTTIARLFAKALNCEQGVSSRPCGLCGSCLEIQQGNFIDLLEIDAASRTKVEDTRELLENVPYRPTRGRYKVYLIDEVHMLSGHSFNALLKTLEEPPEHVKFLLATTDPQKLPVTVLSRCLQFHLKSMTVEQIQNHLARVLTEESVEFEPEALRLLAHSGQGSMRDALSLTDQAIAFGLGKLSAASIASMLGLAGSERLYALLQALAEHNAAELMQHTAEMAEQNSDFGRVLADLLSLLHELSLVQALGQVISSDWDADWLQRLASQILPEELQLYYQIALHGRRDLPLAPNGRCGFEMTLLRMLAFRPQENITSQTPLRFDQPVHRPSLASASTPAMAPASALVPAPVLSPAAAPVSVSPSTPAPAAAVLERASVSAPASVITTEHSPIAMPAPSVTDLATEAPTRQAAERVERAPSSEADFDWPGLVQGLKLAPLVRKLADHCRLLSYQGVNLVLALDPAQQALYSDERKLKLLSALQPLLGEALKLELRVELIAGETPAERAQQMVVEQKIVARAGFEQDPNFTSLQQDFDGRIDEASLKLNS